jgi:hypothetical protein
MIRLGLVSAILPEISLAEVLEVCAAEGSHAWNSCVGRSAGRTGATRE